MKKFWFKAKKYGWGCPSSAVALLRRMEYPATWQGWLVLALYIITVVWDFIRFDRNSHSASDTLINFIPETFLLTLVLIVICYKTGEKPSWRWGGGNKRTTKF